MDKNTITLVVIFLLLGVIAGLILGGKLNSDSLTGKVTYAGLQPETIQVGKLDLNGINKITIAQDNVVCYIKTGQGAGMSCLRLPEPKANNE